jgi:hypothetical protein
VRTILVENTQARIHCIADLALRVTPAITVTAHGAPPPPKDALLPGVNEVNEVEWAKAEKIPLVQHYVEEGIFKVRKSSSELTALPPREAIELVRSTVDRGLLEKWFDIEKRKPVLEAIAAQLDTIKVPPQKNGEK